MAKKFKNDAFLPYYKGKSSEADKQLAVYLRRKFLPLLRKNYPGHSLVLHQPQKRLQLIRQHAKTHSYFLRFDIAKFYPSLKQERLAEVLLCNYQRLSGKAPSQRMKQRLWLEFDSFFSKQAHQFGLPMGTSLSAIIGPAYLLGLCAALSHLPMLVLQDDFLIFTKTKKQLTEAMQIVEQECRFLNVNLNMAKLDSGLIARKKPSFAGFVFSGGHFSVEAHKISGFKQGIIAKTSLRKQYKTVDAFIKQINRCINGFAHYYKHASVKTLFLQLDAFVRARVRRFLLRSRNTHNLVANISYTTNSLYNTFKLRSLADVFCGIKPVRLAKKDVLTDKPLSFYNPQLERMELLLKTSNNLLKELLKVQNVIANELCLQGMHV